MKKLVSPHRKLSARLPKFSTLSIYLLLWVNSGTFLVVFWVKNGLLLGTFWVLFGFLRVKNLR